MADVLLRYAEVYCAPAAPTLDWPMPHPCISRHVQDLAYALCPALGLSLSETQTLLLEEVLMDLILPC